MLYFSDLLFLFGMEEISVFWLICINLKFKKFHSLTYYISRGLTQATAILSNFDLSPGLNSNDQNVVRIRVKPFLVKRVLGHKGRDVVLTRKGLNTKSLTRRFPSSSTVYVYGVRITKHIRHGNHETSSLDPSSSSSWTLSWISNWISS